MGEGDREAVEGAASGAEPSLAPSTTLRAVPLPRCAGEEKTQNSGYSRSSRYQDPASDRQLE